MGRSETHYPTKPSASILETFPNRYPQRDYWIRFDCAEFTSLCPVTGQPGGPPMAGGVTPNVIGWSQPPAGERARRTAVGVGTAAAVAVGAKARARRERKRR